MTYYTHNTPPADDFDIDLSTVEESNFEPIPPGDYVMQCVGVDLTYSKAGNRMLKAQFQVLGGNHDNRRVFEVFNIAHANPDVVAIAQRSIKQWAMACGLTGNERLTMAMLKDLEGREFIGNVKVDKDKSGQFQDSNRLRGYKPLPGAVAPAASSRPAEHATVPSTPPQASHMPPPQAAPQAASGAVKRPWER